MGLVRAPIQKIAHAAEDIHLPLEVIEYLELYVVVVAGSDAIRNPLSGAKTQTLIPVSKDIRQSFVRSRKGVAAFIQMTGKDRQSDRCCNTTKRAAKNTSTR